MLIVVLLLMLALSLISPCSSISGGLRVLSSIRLHNCKTINVSTGMPIKLTTLRGGSTSNDDIDKYVDALDTEDGSSENSSDNNENSVTNTVATSLGDYIHGLWEKTPPMTKVYVVITTLISILSILCDSHTFSQLIAYDLQAVITKFQFWRLASTFFYLGPLGMSFMFSLQYTHQIMSQLEKTYCKHPEEFLVMLLFGAVGLLSIGAIYPINLAFSLISFLIYVWSRVFEGVDVNLFEIVSFKAELFPFVVLLQTILLEQQFPLGEIVGIIIGHFYYYMKTSNLIWMPEMLKDWCDSDYCKSLYKKYIEE